MDEGEIVLKRILLQRHFDLAPWAAAPQWGHEAGVQSARRWRCNAH